MHSRIQPLSLIDLEKAHFGTPELYKNLAVLTNKLRRKYQPGTQSTTGLKLLSCLPGEEETKEAIVNDGSCLDGVDTIKRAEETASSDNIAKEEGGEVDEEKKLRRDGEVCHEVDHMDKAGQEMIAPRSRSHSY